MDGGTIRAMTKTKSPLIYFSITVIVIALLTLFGPEEKSLGSNVRIVYLHGAWVLAAEVAFIAAALGRTGIVFWLTYLPLSLFAMQANWNGLFLAEPRFRIAMIFAVTGVLLQLGLLLFNISWLTSFANILYIITLRVVFATAQNVMHPPPSPIFNSGLWNIILFFVGLNILAWVAGYFLTRFFLGLQPNKE